MSVEDYFDRTLVIMPFLVTTTGESSTSLANKKLYFKLCFDSLYPLFRNILGAVINKDDQSILMKSRPFREVMLFEGAQLFLCSIFSNIVLFLTSLFHSTDRRNDCELPVLALLAVKRYVSEKLSSLSN